MVPLLCVCVCHCWIMLRLVVMWPAKGILKGLFGLQSGKRFPILCAKSIVFDVDAETCPSEVPNSLCWTQREGADCPGHGNRTHPKFQKRATWILPSHRCPSEHLTALWAPAYEKQAGCMCLSILTRRGNLWTNCQKTFSRVSVRELCLHQVTLLALERERQSVAQRTSKWKSWLATLILVDFSWALATKSVTLVMNTVLLLYSYLPTIISIEPYRMWSPFAF